MATDRCDWPGCRGEVLLGWLGSDVCSLHWGLIGRLDEDGRIDEAYTKLKINKKYQRSNKPGEPSPPLPKPEGVEEVIREDPLDFDDLDIPDLEDD